MDYDSSQAMAEDQWLSAGGWRRGRCPDMDEDYDTDNYGYDDMDSSLGFDRDEWSDEPEEFDEIEDEDGAKNSRGGR